MNVARSAVFKAFFLLLSPSLTVSLCPREKRNGWLVGTERFIDSTIHPENRLSVLICRTRMLPSDSRYHKISRPGVVPSGFAQALLGFCRYQWERSLFLGRNPFPCDLFWTLSETHEWGSDSRKMWQMTVRTKSHARLLTARERGTGFFCSVIQLPN